MDYLFFQAAAVNGFDSFGHYLRAGLIVNQCTNYAVEPTAGCSANFRKASASAAVAGAVDAARPRARVDGARAAGRRTRSSRPKAEPARQAEQARRQARSRGPAREAQARAAARPRRGTPGPSVAVARARDPSRAPGTRRHAAAGGAPPTPHPPRRPGGRDPVDPLLDYLFGDDD